MRTIITNANIVNEGRIFKGSVVIENGLIDSIVESTSELPDMSGAQVINAEGKYLFPGVIDDQVHFREPGLTHKADIYTESKAAVAGGTTSFMEMPNTVPNAITIDLLEDKYKLAAEKSLGNYSFYLGASNDNIEELRKLDKKNVCGIKVFLGSSTGNMLVDKPESLKQIFSLDSLVAVHCEDEKTIQVNLQKQKAIYGENIPVRLHPVIRNAEACMITASFAVGLARKYITRLHILHISTADEMALLDNSIPLARKKITSEVCIHHLWFTDADYEEKGMFIKWNPAIKSARDRDALWKALADGRLDVVATDHAPHTLEEKSKSYINAPSGGPLVQHSLVAMLEFYHQGKISLENVINKMCHAPAVCFGVAKRGFIRPGYFADLVIVDLNAPWKVDRTNILSKCGWSPFEGTVFQSQVKHTFINGHHVYDNGTFDESHKGMSLQFERD